MPRISNRSLAAGLIASSQNLAYAISKFLGGILSDQMSARLMFGSGLFFSGLVTIAFSQSDSIFLFTLLWFMNGFAQGAGLYPGHVSPHPEVLCLGDRMARVC